MKKQINIEEFAPNSPSVANSARVYKSYNTIRRDLRTAFAIIERNIKLKSDINSGKLNLKSIGSTLYIERNALMHAITLYTRWFKATTGKPKLSANTFFRNNSVLRKQHDHIIELRDKYLAHNELDLLGSDRVWIEIADDGSAIGVQSDFLENQFINHKELNLEQFRSCVEIVHNKIDAEILPHKEAKLLEVLKRHE